VIKRTGEQTYEVESLNPKSKGTWYKVDIEKNECSCPAWQKGIRRPCKHITLVSDAIAKQIANKSDKDEFTEKDRREDI
jgi:uncharacterized Zn finger protein